MTSNRRDIDGGWAWIVLLAVYVGVVIISTSTYMGGILYVAVLDKYGGDIAVSSLIGSLNTGLLCLCGPLASVYMNMFSCRISIVTGGLLVSLACFTSAFVTDINWLILTYGVLGGIGNAFAATSFVIVLSYYFEKRRNTVITLCTAVVGVGMFLSSPLALTVLHTYGLSGSFLILSGLNAQMCVCGVICFPSTLERKLLEKKKDNKLISGSYDNQGICRMFFKRLLSQFRFNILLNKVFSSFLCSTLTWNLTLSVFLLHLPNYMVTQGATAANIAILMICFSVGNTAGRLLCTITVNKQCLSNFTVHILSLGFVGVLTVIFPALSTVHLLDYCFATVIGLLLGIPNSLAAPIQLDILGVDMISTAHGLEFFFSGIGYIVGPPIAGFLFGLTGTYGSSFYFAGIVVLIGAILGYVSSVLFRRGDKAEIRPQTIQICKQIEEKIDRTTEFQHQSELSTEQPLIEKGGLFLT